MDKSIKIFALSIFIIYLLCDSAVSNAESSIVGENHAARVHINFRIVIPETLYLQFGALQPDVDSTFFNVKNINEAVLAEPGGKKLAVKAAGSLSASGSMHLSSSISYPDDNKGAQPQKIFEYIWNAGRVDSIGRPHPQKENENYSFSSTKTGHFTFHYSRKEDIRNRSRNRIHSYTLCSP